jgi:hypothetical protein
VEPDIVEYDKNNKPQYVLILSVKTMKKYDIILDFNSLSAMDGHDHPLKN